MPTYDYKCENCGHTLEVIQKITEEPLKKCPECKKLKLGRVIAPAGLVFKGTGWYCTDYGNRSKDA